MKISQDDKHPIENINLAKCSFRAHTKSTYHNPYLFT